jgi:Tfp pilus assembly protein PilE
MRLSVVAYSCYPSYMGSHREKVRSLWSATAQVVEHRYHILRKRKKRTASTSQKSKEINNGHNKEKTVMTVQ